MTFLAIVGAIVLTIGLLYLTFAYLVMNLMSDESFFFGWKAYRKEWLIGVVGGFVVLALLWWGWWALIGTHIVIGFAFT